MRDDAPEIGYWLGVPFWGNGYATEAARALIDHAFGDLGYAVLTAGARVSNPASRRVLEKCGFQWTGIGAVPHPRHPVVRAVRPVPAGAGDLGVAAELGRGETRVRRLRPPAGLVEIHPRHDLVALAAAVVGGHHSAVRAV